MPNRKVLSEIDTFALKDVPEIFHPLLKERVSVRNVSEGELISQVGEVNDTILCLVSGKAEVVVGFRAAQEVIIESLEPGDIFGDLAFLTGRRWPTDSGLIAVESSTVLEIPADAFQRVLRENPEFTLALLKSLSKKFVRVERSDFGTPATDDPECRSAVCAYPSHPGIPAEVQKRFQELAFSDESVLIIGENGVGKDVLAYAIFDAAERFKEVLIPVNTRQIGSQSIFSKSHKRQSSDPQSQTLQQIKALFGYEMEYSNKRRKLFPGYLDLAHEGTLFIRRADLLTPVTQQKLLDAWRTGYYCPLGSAKRIKVDFRLICTAELNGKHRETDAHPLLNELERCSLILPPLRDRKYLLPALAENYLTHYALEMKRSVPHIDELTLKAMLDYSWPGNDLELANAMRRAVIVSPGDVIRRQDLSFGSSRVNEGSKFDLLKIRPIKQALLSPLYPAILQSAFVPIFLGIVMLLFLGPPDPSRNLAALIMWSLAWPGVIIGAILGARISCSICAIGALSKLAKKIISLELPFPESLRMRSDFLIAGGILFIIWLESATNIRSSPAGLGMLLVSMFIIAFFLNTLFVRQTWCRYICPLGGMTGLFARTSIIELRADSSVCLSKCAGHECYVGTDESEGCTFGQVVATLHSNQFCKICGNCLKNCTLGAVKLNLRFPGQEISEVRHVRTGTGFLVLSLNAALLSDIISRIPAYQGLSTLSHWPALKFTILYIVLILSFNAVALLAALVSNRAFKENLIENYARFALTFLPFTATAFLAFHLYYLLTLGPQMFSLIGQYFGISSLIHFDIQIPTYYIRVLQTGLIIAGTIWSLIVMFKLGKSSPRGYYRRRWGVFPYFGLTVIFAYCFLLSFRHAFPV